MRATLHWIRGPAVENFEFRQEFYEEFSQQEKPISPSDDG
jgi:hypothetical protein